MSDPEVIDAVELARSGELDAELGSDGVPRRPIVLVRPDGRRFAPPPLAAGVRPIVLLVRDTAAPASPALAAFADLTIAGPGIDHPAAIGHADPSGGARALARAVSAMPCAALAVAGLIRTRAFRDVAGGLFAESAVYSMLQAGPEHARWRAARPARHPPGDDGPRIRAERRDETLTVTLTRAGRHNALDRRLRDELLAALIPAHWDPRIQVRMAGEGAGFSSGGDLDEFGTAPDPPAAHLVRLGTSLGAALHGLRDRTEVRVHGDCVGAGVELPAFAGRVIADPDTTFRLPELGMGLIPGAGGTVSLPRRIGTARMLWLALSGERLDAATALRWGLVDALG